MPLGTQPLSLITYSLLYIAMQTIWQLLVMPVGKVHWYCVLPKWHPMAPNCLYSALLVTRARPLYRKQGATWDAAIDNEAIDIREGWWEELYEDGLIVMAGMEFKERSQTWFLYVWYRSINSIPVFTMSLSSYSSSHQPPLIYMPPVTSAWCLVCCPVRRQSPEKREAEPDGRGR